MEENRIEAMKQEQAYEPEAVVMSEKTAVAAVSDILHFPFQDPEWRKKFIIGGALIFANYIVPIVPMLAVAGYMMKIMGQAIQGEEPSLPEWDDWGDLIIEGLKGTGIAMIYLLPGYFLLISGYLFLIFSPFLALPFTAAAGSGGDPTAGIAASLGVTVVASFLMIVFMGIGLFLILGGLLPLPLAIGNYLKEGEFSAALRVKEIWSLLKVNKRGFVAAWVICFGLIYLMYFPMVLLYFTIILICLLPFILPPFLVYIQSIVAVVFGQYYRETRRIWEEKTAA